RRRRPWVWCPHPPLTGSAALALPRRRTWLKEREVVAARSRAVRRDTIVRLDGRGILELQSAPPEDLEILAAIVRLEDEVVASAPHFRGRARIKLVLAFE